MIHPSQQTTRSKQMDYLEILFNGGITEEERVAGLDAMKKEEAARLAALAVEKAAKDAMRCPRCMGEGRISQFMHNKGGECFLCGGSGVFAGYRG
jgi:hypothetical protein